jgi:hypothetical protein
VYSFLRKRRERQFLSAQNAKKPTTNPAFDGVRGRDRRGFTASKITAVNDLTAGARRQGHPDGNVDVVIKKVDRPVAKDERHTDLGADWKWNPR